jgi:hypothetical protein
MALTTTSTFNVPCGNIKLLEQAVATPGATVNLAAGCTYHLTREFWDPTFQLNENELPLVTGLLTINGHGAVIQGIPTTSLLCCGRILQVGPTGNLTINSLTLRGGRVKSDGGGIASEGTVHLNGSRVVGNVAAAGGGGIWSHGNIGLLSLINSQVSANAAGSGGGIWALGYVTLTSSSVTGNRTSYGFGGGIGFDGVTMILSKSLVSGNRADVSCDRCLGGGGIEVGGQSVLIQQSLLINNSVIGPFFPSGGGLYNYGGTVSFSGSLVKGNTAVNNGGGSAGGGGILNDDAAGGADTVTLSTTAVTSNLPDNCEPTGTIAGCT